MIELPQPSQKLRREIMVEKTIPNKKALQLQSSKLGREIILNIKLMWLLLSDRRVHFLLKLIPISALIYLISPIDLISGVVLPVIGALDDAAVLWIGTSLFLNLCPEQVVHEHQLALGLAVEVKTENEVVDVTARDITGDKG
jgi:uncharacterized membrane protein YkvA (DUF1232 family)